MRCLLIASLLVWANTSQAEVQEFEHAEVTVTWRGATLEQLHSWTPVTLPHNWLTQPPPTNGKAWYRMQFHIDRHLMYGRGHSIYLPKVRLSDLSIHVNGQPIWNLVQSYAFDVSVNALRVPLPPSLLRTGTNTIHLEASGYAPWNHGMTRVYVGDTAMLAKRAAVRSLFQETIIYIIASAFGAIGALSLWLWFRGGRDPVLFWYGVSGVMLLAATAAWYYTLWRYESGLRLGLLFMRYHGYLVPFFILHLRLAGRRYYWLEATLWLGLIAAFFNISNLLSTHMTLSVDAWLGWGLAFSALPALLALPLLASRRLRAKPAVILLVIADFAAFLFPMHDWGWRLGYLDYDRPFLVFYAPAFVMLAAMFPIIERMREGMRARDQSREELERRVAEKTRDIEVSHERLREAQREVVLAEERRRIMADMHDGLGARLVALLSVAQSGKAKHGEISEGIAAALDELRLTVDSVQPVEGDVGVVLGNVRHRMRSVFERSGVKLNWNVSELPRMEDLTPERILAIQRIFLEVLSNAIRHAEARTVSVFAMRVPGAVRIVIEDDGRGFDTETKRAGTGLANLQMRAMQAGGTLTVESRKNFGTRVTFVLSIDSERTVDEPAPADADFPPSVQDASPKVATA